MQKDYADWHKKKTAINNTDVEQLFKEREVWWSSIGLNVGDEQDGKNDSFERPVLILRKFNRQVFWAIPMTSSLKENEYYYQISHEDKNFSLVLSQIRLLSSKRLIRRIRTIDDEEFEKIKTAFCRLLKNNETPR